MSNLDFHAEAHEVLWNIIKATSSVVFDKEEQIQNTLICLLAKGHLLIEDQPGVGKTTLAQCVALLMGLKSNRIQFTNDLLPSDILGHMVFNSEKHEFYFKEGPLFSEIILADELNRAHPKTQSALLQAMEEGQISLEGKTYPLPELFFLMATQNPKSQIGTHPLPESQVDRFLMALHLDYISTPAEIKLLMGTNPREKLIGLKPLIDKTDLIKMMQLVSQIHIDEKIATCIADILHTTRIHQNQFQSLSSRAGLALVQACKARAFLFKRKFITPDDLHYMLKPVLAHRLADQEGLIYGEKKVEELLQLVKIPN